MSALADLAADPSPLSRRLTLAGTPFTVRGLEAGDAAALVSFLAGLSATSRRFWHGDTDPADEAAGWIDAIGRYDKLRLVAHPDGRDGRLAGVVDLSFSLPDGFEISRYAAAGRTLDPRRTIRFGLCVADAWQGRGLAAALLPPAWNAACLLDRDHVVLFGGVHTANFRARRFYLRHGFTEVAPFAGPAGEPHLDMDRHLP